MTERDDSVHVVFGAAGAIGSAVVTELVHAGRDVRAVSRGGQPRLTGSRWCAGHGGRRVRPGPGGPRGGRRVCHLSLLAAAGIFSPLLRQMRETTYQFRAPFVIDASKFEAAFGHLEPTSHRDAIQPTIAWYRSR